MSHVSCVICQMTHVTCHMSHVIFFFTNGRVSFVEGQLLTGSTPTSFLDFSFLNALIPNIYLTRLVVVRFWSLKKQIDENLIRDIVRG